MRKKKFILLILNLVLVLTIYLSIKTESEDQSDYTIRLISTISNLNEIVIRNVHNEEIHLTQKNQEWHMKTPFSWSVEDLFLASFNTRISHLDIDEISKLSSIAEKGELAEDYGILDNSPTITLIDADQQIRIKVGTATREENSVFITFKINDDDEMLCKCSNDLLEIVQLPASVWAQPTFIKQPLYSINAINVSYRQNNGENHVVSLLKTKEIWNFTKPFKSLANNERVLLLLNEIASKKIERFKNEEGNDINDSNESDWLIKLTLQSRYQSENIYFGSENTGNGQYTIARNETEPTKLYLESNFMEIFEALPSKLRERKILQFSSLATKSISIKHQGKTLALAKKDEKWSVLERNETKEKEFSGDDFAIGAFFNLLNNLHVKEFISLNPDANEIRKYGLQDPQYVIKFIDTNDSTSQVVLSKNHEDQNLFTAYIENESLICLLEIEIPSLLNPSHESFINRNLLNADSKVATIRFEYPEGNSTSKEVLTNLDSSFDNFTNLRAQNFLDVKYHEDGCWVAGDWLPWTYNLIFLDDKNQTINSFNLSAPSGATTWYGGSSKTNRVFNMPINIIDELNSLLREIRSDN